jgi:dimethylglycine dehydrogenase
MVMLDRDLAREGTDLKIHIVGQEHAARVIAGSPYAPYDPSGAAMRA